MYKVVWVSVCYNSKENRNTIRILFCEICFEVCIDCTLYVRNMLGNQTQNNSNWVTCCQVIDAMVKEENVVKEACSGSRSRSTGLSPIFSRVPRLLEKVDVKTCKFMCSIKWVHLGFEGNFLVIPNFFSCVANSKVVSKWRVAKFFAWTVLNGDILFI